MFSGIGGFELGIQRAEDNKNLQQRTRSSSYLQSRGNSSNCEGNARKSDESRFECVGYSEIDKYAITTYQKHFPDHTNYGDCTKINPEELPDFDFLCGGFPCQAFSIAGKRKGFEDVRGTLFFDIARIIKVKRPKVILLENVKGLLNHEKGKTFSVIIQTLAELGYRTQWMVLNSKFFGVPQNRERVFIIGSLRGERRPEVLPFREDGPESNKEETAQCLTKRLHKMGRDDNYIKQINNPIHSNDRVYSDTGISPTINTAQGGNRQPFVKAVLTPTREKKRQEGRRFKENGEPSFTVTSQDQHGVMLDTKIRRLTPIECERLQGFPELESFINFSIQNNILCLELQKSYVNVEMLNHKSPKYVGNVEKKDLKENVLSAEQNLNINNQQINKPVQKNVLINCVGEKVEILNHGKSSSFVNYVKNQNLLVQPIKEEIFAQLIAGINITLEKTITFGKEELLQKEQSLIQVKNGKMFVKLFGKGIMQLVKDAKIDLIILNKHLKFITSNHLDLKKIDSNWIISFSYVINAIIGFIQKEINQENLFLQIYNRQGWTIGSDTQRYKQCGNAVTVNVIEAIVNKVQLSNLKRNGDENNGNN